MDFLLLLFLGFIFVVAIVMLGDLLRGATIVLALMNDLYDLGVLVFAFPEVDVLLSLGWIFDVIVFILIAVSYRSAYSLISLLDLIPMLGFLPFHSLSLLLSKIKRKKKREG